MFLWTQKELFYKNDINYKSTITFKDKNGYIKLLSNENDNKLHSNLDDVIDDINLQESNGDSGYSLEHFFGQFLNQNTTHIIAKNERKIILVFY